MRKRATARGIVACKNLIGRSVDENERGRCFLGPCFRFSSALGGRIMFGTGTSRALSFPRRKSGHRLWRTFSNIWLNCIGSDAVDGASYEVADNGPTARQPCRRIARRYFSSIVGDARDCRAWRASKRFYLIDFSAPGHLVRCQRHGGGSRLGQCFLPCRYRVRVRPSRERVRSGRGVIALLPQTLACCAAFAVSRSGVPRWGDRLPVCGAASAPGPAASELTREFLNLKGGSRGCRSRQSQARRGHRVRNAHSVGRAWAERSD